MRIAQIITPRRLAGAERHAIALSRALMERGHEVSLITRTEAPYLMEAAAQAGVPAQAIRIGAYDPLAARRIAQFVKRNKIELIATHLRKAAHWGGWAGKLAGVPVVSTVHAPRDSGHPYARADALIAVSGSVKTALIEEGIEASRIHVVYNGIDMKKFGDAYPVDTTAAKVEVGIPIDSLVVGIAAHLSLHKGHAWAMEALAPLCQQNPQLLFLMLGDGPQHEALEAQTQSLGMTSQVIFAGFQTNVVPWISAMDLMLLPSLKAEGFGLVLAEAGALGKPVIAANDGGSAEVVEPGKTGLLVAPNDVVGLRAAIEQLLGNAEQRAQFGIAGRERVVQLFTEEAMVDQTLRVYENALRRK